MIVKSELSKKHASMYYEDLEVMYVWKEWKIARLSNWWSEVL